MIRPAPFDRVGARGRRRLNALQSVLLIGGMVALLAACGWVVAGVRGILLAVWFGGLAMVVSMRMSPRVHLKMLGAVPLPWEDAPELHAALRELAERAGLAHPPALYYVSSRAPTALTVGGRDAAGIAMTTELLRLLSPRELVGVLAHETSHVRNNDLWVLGLAGTIGQMTRTMSLLGMILLALNLPLVLANLGTVPWALVALLVLAPSLVTLLRLALSRTREFDADLDAAALTGDPQGLASALEKLEWHQDVYWRRLFPRAPKPNEPAALRSHPKTRERVRRLSELAAAPPPMPPLNALAGRTRRSIIPATAPPRRSRLWELLR